MKVEQALEKMGLTLLEPAVTQVGHYVPAVQVDNVLFVSGHTGARLYEFRGKVGRDLTVEQGCEAAKLAMLGCLGSIKFVLGDLDRVDRIIKLLGFINATEGFGDTPAILNGASDLLIELYGESGKHARSAIGIAALPGNAPVEIEMIITFK